MSDSKNEISDLCVSCGMCCDGTLFETGFVRDETDRKVADDLGMVTMQIRDKLFFELPCRHFSGCCTVYGRQRPYTCSVFFCPPIKRYEHKEQTFSEAEQQILLLKEHRDKLLKIASQFPDLQHLNFRELKNKLGEYAGDEDKITMYRLLFLNLFILEDIQTKYFTPAKENTLLV